MSATADLFLVDQNLFTCAGGDAALDMMLTLIRQDHGHQLANQVADLFMHSNIRQANEQQRMTVRLRTGTVHPRLISCIELMEANIEQPLSTQEIATVVGISKRQLERLFKMHMHTTPNIYYQKVRLQTGQKLLDQTSLSVLEIALLCGFTTSGHFSRRFREYFGTTPRQYRNRP